MIITFAIAKAIRHVAQKFDISRINWGNGDRTLFSGRRTCHLARTDSSTGASGVAELSGSLLLAANNFYRTFTDDPAATAAAQALPEMRGSGAVRDLPATQVCRKHSRIRFKCNYFCINTYFLINKYKLKSKFSTTHTINMEH